MDIGIRLHDTVNGTLEERLRYVREQGFSCALSARALLQLMRQASTLLAISTLLPVSDA